MTFKYLIRENEWKQRVFFKVFIHSALFNTLQQQAARYSQQHGGLMKHSSQTEVQTGSFTFHSDIVINALQVICNQVEHFSGGKARGHIICSNMWISFSAFIEM